MPKFDFLMFHENFEDHQAAAGRRVVTEELAEQAWYGQRAFVPNKRSGKGPFLMIGNTDGGHEITVVILATADEDTWQAYTAWFS